MAAVSRCSHSAMLRYVGNPLKENSMATEAEVLAAVRKVAETATAQWKAAEVLSKAEGVHSSAKWDAERAKIDLENLIRQGIDPPAPLFTGVTELDFTGVTVTGLG